MALLDIVITHYNEKWADGRKMFEMLKLQRGVNPEDFRVILVQDGPDDALDLQRVLRAYPFVSEVIEAPHGGISRARNAGLDAAESKWIMFCDYDDCLYSIDSLFRILESLKEAGDRADLVYSEFWIEMHGKNGGYTKTLKGMNSVFIHGKCYRRQFLLDKGIRFEEDLDYSEDALFNALVLMETKLSRIAKMPEVCYVWCLRENSLSNYEGGWPKRNQHLYRKRVLLIEEYEKRGMDYQMKCNAARAILEYYFELNGKDEPPEGGTMEEWLQRVKVIVDRWPGVIEGISPFDRAKLWEVVKQDAAAKKLIKKDMKPAEIWLKEIGAIQGDYDIPETADEELSAQEMF